MNWRAGAFRWAGRVVLIGAAVAGLGCPASPGDDATAREAERVRREGHREQLRESLGEEYDRPLADPTIEQIRHGAKLYDKLCRSCHGISGRGDGRAAPVLLTLPPDLADPLTASFYSDRAKLTIIAEGVDGTPMVRWGGVLDQQDRLALVHFMRTLMREPR